MLTPVIGVGGVTATGGTGVVPGCVDVGDDGELPPQAESIPTAHTATNRAARPHEFDVPRRRRTVLMS
jgi:hypothetical protein